MKQFLVHLQGSYMLEKKEWPMFRKVMEDRISVKLLQDSQSTLHTYTEGWGLYSETLGFDLDFIQIHWIDMGI